VIGWGGFEGTGFWPNAFDLHRPGVKESARTDSEGCDAFLPATARKTTTLGRGLDALQERPDGSAAWKRSTPGAEMLTTIGWLGTLQRSSLGRGSNRSLVMYRDRSANPTSSSTRSTTSRPGLPSCLLVLYCDCCANDIVLLCPERARVEHLRENISQPLEERRELLCGSGFDEAQMSRDVVPVDRCIVRGMSLGLTLYFGQRSRPPPLWIERRLPAGVHSP